MRRRIQGRLARVHCSGARRSRPADVLSGFAAKTRLAMACRIGADVVLDHRVVDVAAEVQRLTGGGADVAIEALDTPATFEGAFRSLRPAGTLSSLGVYSGKLGSPTTPSRQDSAIIASFPLDRIAERLRAVRRTARRGAQSGDHALAAPCERIRSSCLGRQAASVIAAPMRSTCFWETTVA